MGIEDLIMGDKVEFLGKFRFTEYLIEKDKYITSKWYKNIITNKFKYALAEVVSGGYDIDLHTFNKLAVGTGTTAVAATDLTLTTQLGALKEPVTGSIHNSTSQNIAEGTWFFDYNETTYYGEWKEIGLYAKNDTDLLTHALIDPTKTLNNTKTITVQYQLEF